MARIAYRYETRSLLVDEDEDEQEEEEVEVAAAAAAAAAVELADAYRGLLAASARRTVALCVLSRPEKNNHGRM